MHSIRLDLFIWAASFFGNSLLSCIMFLRGRARSFPFFTTYIVYQAIDNVVGSFVVRTTFTTYQHYYWSANLGEQILKLLAFYEVAIHVFRPTGVWARDVRKTFIGLVALSLIVACALTVSPSPNRPSFF